MDIRVLAFKARGFTPIPFVLAALAKPELRLSVFIIGLLLSLIGEGLRIRSIRYAGGATRTRRVGASDLVTDGPFSLTRNPLYLANMMMYTGYALASFSCFPYLPVLTLLFFALQYGLIISLEESTLRKLFGNQYVEYCRAVPRLFPRRILHPKHALPRYSLKEALRQERSTLAGLFLLWIALGLRLLLI